MLLALCLLLVTVVACARDGGDAELRAASTTSTTERTTTSTTTLHAPRRRPRRPPRRRDRRSRPPPPRPPVRPRPPVTAEPQVLPFAATIKTVTAQDLHASWRPGCPVPVEQLRADRRPPLRQRRCGAHRTADRRRPTWPTGWWRCSATSTTPATRSSAWNRSTCTAVTTCAR